MIYYLSFLKRQRCSGQSKFCKKIQSYIANKLVVIMLDLNIIVITVEKTNTEHLRPHPWPKHTHQWDDDKKIVVLLDNLFPGVELEVYVLAACWLYCGDQTIDNYLESEVECSNNNEMVYQFNFQVDWGHQRFNVVLINLFLLVLEQSTSFNCILHYNYHQHQVQRY